MKCLTLNSHSLVEPEYEKKLAALVEGIWKEQPDVMAFQESSQSVCAEEVPETELEESGFVPCPFCPLIAEDAKQAKIRRDNHAFRIAVSLRSLGLAYFWTWTGAKIGYGKYDDGLAIFSREPVLAACQFYLTASHDYQDWKTRKALSLSISTGKEVSSFVCVHMGWWEDDEDPFSAQWKRLLGHLHPLKKSGHIWLMGDFNSPDQVRGEGYDLIRDSGWRDTYLLAEKKDSGITVPGQIDGWRNQENAAGMRIDYIWLSPEHRKDQPLQILSSRVLFNGRRFSSVSDHYGVLIEWEYQPAALELGGLQK